LSKRRRKCFPSAWRVRVYATTLMLVTGIAVSTRARYVQDVIAWGNGDRCLIVFQSYEGLLRLRCITRGGWKMPLQWNSGSHELAVPPYTMETAPQHEVALGVVTFSSGPGLAKAARFQPSQVVTLWTITSHSAWLILLGGLSLVMLLLIAFLRRPTRPRKGFCAGCDYDLRASRHRCPECGRKFESVNPPGTPSADTRPTCNTTSAG